jgi:hypothetical protein
MKPIIFPRAISLTAALAAMLASTTLATGQDATANPPPSAPAANNIYKINYIPPAAQVEKLVKAGLGEDVIKAYVSSVPYPFNLNSDTIIHLQSIGVSGAVLSEMLNHDKSLRDSSAMNSQVAPPLAYPQTQPSPDAGAYPANPQAPAVDYATQTPDYYNDLSPYGNWAYDDGYGWGWQGYPGLGYAYYPWGILGYGGWRYWPNRGWCWYPNSRSNGFGRTGGFAGNRFGGGFRGSAVGNRSYSGFHGGFSAAVSRAPSGGAHFSAGHSGGFSGGHSGGFSGGHAGGSGGGHGGGGHR